MSPLTILLIATVNAPAGEGGSTGDPFTPAVVRAAHEALGSATRIVVQRVESLPSDDDAIALGEAAHADAVVEVVWSPPEHLESTIRVEQPKWGRWVTREIGFRTIDEPTERSRTVGFAIASMLPEYIARHEPLPPPIPPTEPEHAESRGPARGAAGSVAVVDHRNSISVAAVAAFGVGDHDGGFGGALDFRRGLVPTLAMRFAVGARVGDEPPPDVALRFFYGAAGASWTAWKSSNSRISLGVRLDALLSLLQLVHRPTDSGTTYKYKLIPGSDLLAEAGYFFSREAALVVGAGGEALFGRTNVIVGAQPAATLRPLHPVVEAGLRVGF